MAHGNKQRRVSLALQGGGAHGAFTWGVLDYVLETGALDIEAVSGTSAGAMNAVVLAHGLATGGREGARQALADFWHGVAGCVPFDVVVHTLDGETVSVTPTMKMMLGWTQLFSPYQLNPFDLNPLRGVITRLIDFERLHRQSPLRLFVAATQVNTGRLRLFREHEMTPEVLLASACLPSLHHTMTIEGEPYWDGGYSANPAVFPLFYECRSRDIVLVLINPIRHRQTPRTAEEIRTRTMELGFSATFVREMRTFAHARGFAAAQPWWARGRLERRLLGARFHLIEANDAMGHLPAETKLTPHRPFLEQLRDLGRARAACWFDAVGHHLGKRSSVEIDRLFLAEEGDAAAAWPLRSEVG